MLPDNVVENGFVMPNFKQLSFEPDALRRLPRGAAVSMMLLAALVLTNLLSNWMYSELWWAKICFEFEGRSRDFH